MKKKNRQQRLKNLKNELVRIDHGTTKKDKYGKYNKYEVYADPENNNRLLILACADKKKNLPGDVFENVANWTVNDKAYDYLIKTLNMKRNINVIWMKCEETTSDYVICYGKAACKRLKKISSIEQLFTFCNSEYKYSEIKNKKNHPLKFC